MTEQIQLYEWSNGTGANLCRKHGSGFGRDPRGELEQHMRANDNYDNPDHPLQTPPPMTR